VSYDLPVTETRASTLLAQAVPAALERLRELANSDDPAIAAEATAALLARTGRSP
jgi:hypothetical protein